MPDDLAVNQPANQERVLQDWPDGIRPLAIGPWEASEISLSGFPAPAQIWSDEVEAEVNRRWALANGEAERHRKRLFDGPMVRLESFSTAVHPGGLHLSLSPTRYRYFWAMHLAPCMGQHPAITDTPLPSPIGVSAAVITSDGQILLGVRSHAVAYHPGEIHPIAGALEPEDVAGDSPVGLFRAPIRELIEETGVPRDAVLSTRLLALVQDRELQQPELIFEVRVNLSVAEIVLNAMSAVDHWEATALWSRPSDEARAAVAESPRLFTPVARAAVHLLTAGI